MVVRCFCGSGAARVGPGKERLDYFTRRPKGMRRVTYLRVKVAAMRALERYHAALAVRFVGWLASFGYPWQTIAEPRRNGTRASCR